jgi:hypothetical protein
MADMTSTCRVLARITEGKEPLDIDERILGM